MFQKCMFLLVWVGSNSNHCSLGNTTFSEIPSVPELKYAYVLLFKYGMGKSGFIAVIQIIVNKK